MKYAYAKERCNVVGGGTNNTNIVALNVNSFAIAVTDESWAYNNALYVGYRDDSGVQYSVKQSCVELSDNAPLNRKIVIPKEGDEGKGTDGNSDKDEWGLDEGGDGWGTGLGKADKMSYWEIALYVAIGLLILK